MRTLVDIPEKQLSDLALLCERRKVSRAEVIRQAITVYLDANQHAPDEAFGILKKRQVDGLAYQQKARSEW